MAGKLITVFGATGSQGHPIARALLTKGYNVRALTRNPDNPKAQELKAKGAEVFQVKNMDDNAVLETAIKGAYGVFCNTNYWGNDGRESQHCVRKRNWPGKGCW